MPIKELNTIDICEDVEVVNALKVCWLHLSYGGWRGVSASLPPSHAVNTDDVTGSSRQQN